MFLFDGRRSHQKRSLTRLWTLLIVLTSCVGVQAQGTYSVMAPSVLRPNRDYTVVVATHNTQGPLRLGVEVTGNIASPLGNTGEPSVFLSRQEALLETDSSQLLMFQMGDLSPGDYHLSISGVGRGLEFRNITSLQFEPKSYSVFIETDRAIYAPGDLVQMRVIVVNPSLRPTVTGAIDVHVEDGSGVIVKQWPRVFTSKGVWSSELQLSQEPVLGDWTIVVTVLGQHNKGTFFVAEFVEPKFDVSVKLPEYLSLDDENMIATVEANYPYGQPIKGEVTLQVTPRYKYEYLQAPYDAPVSFVKGIMGKVDIPMNLKTDIGLQGDYARELDVTAYVKEELTGRVQNTTSIVTVYRFPYRMKFIRSSDTFKPGLKYTAYIELSYQDGRPITSGEIFVRHAFLRDENSFVETRHRIPDNGIVTIEVFPPLQRPGPTWTLAFEARYLNLTQWLGEVPRARSPGGAFLQATIITANPMVGEEVVVGLNSTEPLVYFVNEVISGGNVLQASTLQAHQGTTHNFRFVATNHMYPRSRLLIYYMRADGEVVADSLHFNVERKERDKVTLSVNPSWVDVGGSGGTASISVAARPNSIVGITAVDKMSLQLRGGGYRLDKTDIISELESYDPGQLWQLGRDSQLYYRGQNLRRTKRSVEGAYNWYGTSTAYDVFQNAGMVVMTNAHVFRQPELTDGSFLPGYGPIDGRGWDPNDRPAAHNGPFGRLPVEYGVSTLRPDLGPGVAYKAPPRPPLAGPYAFSFLPPPPDHKPRVYLSQGVTPTWLFKLKRTGQNGIITWREEVPKIPNTYAITAFAIDDFDGLALADNEVTITGYRPFYINMRLPTAVMKGEAVAVELVVFNSLSRDLSVEVTIDNSQQEFLFPDFSNEIDQGSPAVEMKRDITVEARGRTTLSFMIVPQTLGSLVVKVSASDVLSSYFDSVSQVLNVKPEGQQLRVNKAIYVDTAAEPSLSTVLNVTVPRNIVADSLKIEMSAIGDILAGAVTSLHQLLQLPRGCGEQNMATTVPVMLTMQHLQSVGELSRVLEERGKQELELRFQQQLTYRQNDGSFSYFDEYRQAHGSTWLTAFVAKTLRTVGTYIDVPRHVITDALAWLVRQQKRDGSFTEPLYDDATPMNNTRESPLALTSYVLLAILEVEDYSSPAVRNAGNRALEYISSLLTAGDVIDDVYGLSIATYALHRAGHAHRDTAFYMLEGLAVIEDGEKWWKDAMSRVSTEEGNTLVSAATVEQTAYALLTYSLRSLAVDSVPVIQWLTAHRNKEGGFTSSQDTAVGLSALYAVSELVRQLVASDPQSASAGGTLNIRVVYGERGHMFTVQRNNARVLQKIELPPDTRHVELSTSGTGRAVVQLSYQYNVQVTAPRPAFSLDPQLDRTTDSNRLRLTSCTGLIARDNITASNMAVMEVQLPSGYVIDNDALPGLYDYPHVKRVERLSPHSKSGDKEGVAIYFDTLTTTEVCPTVVAARVNRVAFQKPTPVLVYDYYDLRKQSRQFYDAAPATLCDICDIGECDPNTCDVQIAEINRQRQVPDDDGYPATIVETSSAPVITSTVVLVVVMVLLNLQALQL